MTFRTWTNVGKEEESTWLVEYVAKVGTTDGPARKRRLDQQPPLQPRVPTNAATVVNKGIM